MIIQQSTSITVCNSDTIDSIPPEAVAFRVSRSVSKNTSTSGESAYLTFNANETKTIAIPIGYSSDDRSRFIGEVSGTILITVDHPTLGDQPIVVKQGSILFSMRMDGITCTEMAGASASIKWSIMQIDDVNSEDFQ